MILDELKEILPNVYCKETAHEDWKDKWTKDNPSVGQCVPTALLVQYYFGGEIYKLNNVSHYFNKINGEIIDLTKDQFDFDLDYEDSVHKQPDLKKATTLERFHLLKDKVENYKNIK